ncbi:RWP-RK domain [Phytophthora cinnamomi]|uniref:RWP-RK domain n=1 Tax=Phytophthora cinnamomi TaxID=4785 RepID=UPI00355AC3C8|nr:RWP-RK domain [Phytophthora cinnamomi]
MGALSPIAKVPAKAPVHDFKTPIVIDCEPESPPSSPKPEKKSRRKFNFDLPTLQAYSHYRQDDAAALLGVSAITLKRNCHRLQYRWPYRTIKAQARRAAKLEAQRLQRQSEFNARRNPPPSPSTLAPELLLHLRGGNTKTSTTSPTSITNAPSPIYPRPPTTVHSPTAQFPLLDKRSASPQLPPLSLLLAKHRYQSTSVTPTYVNANHVKRSRYQHQENTVNYKNPIYAASFEPTAPKFPLGRLAVLSLANACEIGRRGF